MKAIKPNKMHTVKKNTLIIENARKWGGGDVNKKI